MLVSQHIRHEKVTAILLYAICKSCSMMLTSGENYTSCLREHLNIGEPGLAIKSPSCPPITKSRSLTAMQALHQITSVR